MLILRLRIALALAIILTTGAMAAQDASQTAANDSGPEQQFAAWKLRAATGVPGPAELAELEALIEAVEANENLAELLTQLEESRQTLQDQLTPDAERSTPSSAKAAAEKEVLRLALEKAIAEGNTAFIRSLGSRAIPALKEMAGAWDGSPASGEEEPALYWLTLVSAPDGLDVALELMGSKSFLIKRSTMRTLDKLRAFSRSREGVWRPEGETDWRLAQPEWEQILHRALEEPALQADAFKKIIEYFVAKGQLPQSLGDAAIEANVTFTSGDVVPEEGLWYLERMASSQNLELRANAAWWLGRLGEESLALELAQDPDVNVRSGLARNFLGTDRDRYLDRATRMTKRDFVPNAMTPVRFKAFLELASDKDENVYDSVRQSLAKYLKELKSAPFSSEQLISLFGRVTDVNRLRNLIGTIQHLPEAERFSTIAAFAQQLAKQDAETRARLLDCLAPQPYAHNAKPYLWIKALSEKDRGWVIRTIYGDEEALKNKELISSCVKAGKMELIKSREVLTQLIADEAAPKGARLWAVSPLVQLHGSSIGVTEIAIMVDLVVSTKGRYEAEAAASSLPHPKNQEFLQLLASDPVATPEFILSSLSSLPEAISQATLEALWPRLADVRWGKLEGNASFGAFGVVAALASRSTEALDPRLNQIDFANFYARRSLFQAAGRSRNPLLLPLIRKVIDRPDVMTSNAWIEVSNALGAYMSDDAAELLLDAARLAPDKQSRDQAMAALDEVTQWRAAAAAWQKSKSAGAKRSQAIADLVIILDDAAQSEESRAAAIRGLGLLQAVEELPRIVRALSGKEEALREAARAAMERMEK